jgi:hypothetical protein
MPVEIDLEQQAQAPVCTHTCPCDTSHFRAEASTAVLWLLCLCCPCCLV